MQMSWLFHIEFFYVKYIECGTDYYGHNSLFELRIQGK